ncbi:MarC family protein [Kiritimatiellaeota bacterium B1221]|nr:MarC family protein [Kiritimatiellaeota bacterium B1221]
MSDLLNSMVFLFVLLNPFLLIVYLTDVAEKLNPKPFAGVLLRGGMIAAVIFCAFASLGDAIFSNLMQADFASFQIFGGVVFLLIGIQFVFKGPSSIELLRGDSDHLAGAIAMPMLIGPGTISASVLIGKRHELMSACLVIFLAVMLSMFIMIALKLLHDAVRTKHTRLIEHYIEISGRITALFIGTVSVEMIMRGLQSWVQKF